MTVERGQRVEHALLQLLCPVSARRPFRSASAWCPTTTRRPSRKCCRPATHRSGVRRWRGLRTAHAQRRRVSPTRARGRSAPAAMIVGSALDAGHLPHKRIVIGAAGPMRVGRSRSTCGHTRISTQASGRCRRRAVPGRSGPATGRSCSSSRATPSCHMRRHRHKIPP